MYIKVRVLPKSKKETIKKIDDQTFEMMVKEPAERNLANERIKNILADEYGIKRGGVRMVSGHHSQSKIFDVMIDL